MSKPMTLDEMEATLDRCEGDDPHWGVIYEMVRRLRALDGYTRKLTPQMGRAVRRILNGEKL